MSLFVNDYLKYDLYQLFLLNKNNFSMSGLRKAYQRQVLIYHPDKFDDNLSEVEKKEKMDIFLLINNGYTILSNETTRKEYDEKRETYLSEEKGFGSLKSQFRADKNKYTLSPEEISVKKIDAEIEFKEKMEQMNLDLVQKMNITTNLEVNENIQSHNLDETFLTSETVKPSDNFTNELSNITTNRKIKIENEGTELYSGLENKIGGSITDKYAYLSEAFKN